VSQCWLDALPGCLHVGPASHRYRFRWVRRFAIRKVSTTWASVLHITKLLAMGGIRIARSFGELKNVLMLIYASLHWTRIGVCCLRLKSVENWTDALQKGL